MQECILPRMWVCHFEFASVTSINPNPEDRKISMLMKFREKIFGCYTEMNYKWFFSYNANDESEIIVIL